MPAKPKLIFEQSSSLLSGFTTRRLLSVPSVKSQVILFFSISSIFTGPEKSNSSRAWVIGCVLQH